MTAIQDAPLDDFPPKAEAALAEWAAPLRRARKGAELRLRSERLGLDARVGGDGQFRMANFGAGMGAAIAIDAALETPWAGSRSMGWMGFAATMALASCACQAAGGAARTWNAARAEGAGRLEAFSRCARSFAHLARARAPNIAAIPMVPLGAAASALIAASNSLNAKPNPGLAAQAADMASDGASFAVSIFVEAHDRIERWKASHAIRAAFFMGSEAANECYAAIDDARVRIRWGLGSDCVCDGEAASSMLPHRESALREELAPLVRAADDTREGLLVALRKAEASGCSPWSSPAPGLPSLVEMGQALLARLGGPEGPDDPIAAILASMSALSEAHEIRGAVGAAIPIDSPPAARRRHRL